MNENQIEEYIKFIESFDMTSTGIQEIRNILEPIVGLISLGTPLIDNSYYFYRAVKLQNKPNLFNDLIYPPKDKLKKYQRLNEPFCPVFYCATSKHASVFEGRYSEGDLVTISEWEILEGEVLMATNIGYTEHLKKWSNRKQLDWHKGVKVEDISDDSREANKVSLNFLSKLFCRNFDNDNYKYKLTIAISNLLGFNTESEGQFEKTGEKQFIGVTPFDAIMYPSILMNAKADNLAIRRFSFHKKIKFVSAEFVKINSVTKDEFDIEEIDFANKIDENGKILWKGRKGNFIVPQGTEVTLTKVAENKFTIERKDGGKLYKD